MNTKLTLNINKSIVQKAKMYAKEEEISLSKLIESYLVSLVEKREPTNTSVTPLVKSLTGVIPEHTDDESEVARYNYLSEKYS